MSTKSEINALLNRTPWREERRKLRSLILECALEEHVKWGKLCYTFEGGNVVIIYGLKHYCALGFFKGSVLEDPDNLLVSPGKHSQAMRQLRFTDLAQIEDSEVTISGFIEKAIQAEKSGLKVKFVEKNTLVYPDELQEILADDPELSAAFEELTPGRRRGYVLHFSNARQSTTRRSRIGKCRTRILQGKGLHERQA